MAQEKNGNGLAPSNGAPRATKAELQKLMAGVQAADKGVQAAQKALDKARAAQSAAVQELCTKAQSKGPFKTEDGRILTGVERVNKETGVSTWYFKGPNQTDVIEL